MKVTTMTLIRSVRTIGVILLALSLCPACEPKPGTADFVLAKLKKGEKPTKEEFGLLGPIQVPAMLAIVKDKSLATQVRQANLDVLLNLDWPGHDRDFRELLSSDDPQIRLKSADHFTAETDPETAMALLSALKLEKVEITRDHLGRVVQRLGMRPDPNPTLRNELLKMARSTDKTERLAAAMSLGGWMGKEVTEVLENLALSDPDKGVQGAAARSLVTPSVRYLDDLLPRLGRLLAKGEGEVRVWALNGLYTSMKETRGPIGKPCGKDHMLEVLNYIPDLREKAEMLSDQGGPYEQKAADELLRCFYPKEGKPDGGVNLPHPPPM